MAPEISDETLMAFADGVLDEPRFSQVAEAVEADPALAERLHALTTGSDLARAGYREMLRPAPPELVAGVRASIERSQKKSFWARLFSGVDLVMSGVVAASLFMALVALPVGYLLGRSAEPSPHQMLDTGRFADILGRTPSGQVAELADGTNVSLVATFSDAAGNLCREFETTGETAYIAVACRLGGTWQTGFTVAVGGNGADYRPASGHAALDAYLQAIGASAPLLDADESRALGQ